MPNQTGKASLYFVAIVEPVKEPHPRHYLPNLNLAQLLRQLDIPVCAREDSKRLGAFVRVQEFRVWG